MHEPNKNPHPAKTGGPSIKLSWDHNPAYDHTESLWWGAPWGYYSWGIRALNLSSAWEAKRWVRDCCGYHLAHHNHTTVTGLPPGQHTVNIEWSTAFGYRTTGIGAVVIEVEDLLPGATTPTGTWR